MLHEFIAANRHDILRRCQAKAATRFGAAPVTHTDVDQGVPLFLNQLIDALRPGQISSSDIDRSALQHGRDRLRQGFTVSQLVHDYGDVCQAVTDLAVDRHARISLEDFRTLNRCLDDAIAGAVSEYGRARNDSTLEQEQERGSERLGFLAHEVRNLLNTALLAFEVLKTGTMGVGGSTGAVLHRSLKGLETLITRSLAEVSFMQGVQRPEQFLVSAFIDELAPAATLEARARGVELLVPTVDDSVVIDADRQVLTAVVGNLLQNGFKFTRPGSTVILRVEASADRVLIEVQDECGGLPDGNVHDMFRPFEQYGVDRTGVGLGLAFSRWGVEANGGRLYVSDLPDKGCVFTVDLPRLPVFARVTA